MCLHTDRIVRACQKYVYIFLELWYPVHHIPLPSLHILASIPAPNSPPIDPDYASIAPDSLPSLHISLPSLPVRSDPAFHRFHPAYLFTNVWNAVRMGRQGHQSKRTVDCHHHHHQFESHYPCLHRLELSHQNVLTKIEFDKARQTSCSVSLLSPLILIA